MTFKKRRYSFPLCDLEVVDRNSENFIPVDDIQCGLQIDKNREV